MVSNFWNSQYICSESKHIRLVVLYRGVEEETESACEGFFVAVERNETIFPSHQSERLEKKTEAK